MVRLDSFHPTVFGAGPVDILCGRARSIPGGMDVPAQRVEGCTPKGRSLRRPGVFVLSGLLFWDGSAVPSRRFPFGKLLCIASGPFQVECVCARQWRERASSRGQRWQWQDGPGCCTQRLPARQTRGAKGRRSGACRPVSGRGRRGVGGNSRQVSFAPGEADPLYAGRTSSGCESGRRDRGPRVVRAGCRRRVSARAIPAWQGQRAGKILGSDCPVRGIATSARRIPATAS
jgi:hypothetical protein